MCELTAVISGSAKNRRKTVAVTIIATIVIVIAFVVWMKLGGAPVSEKITFVAGSRDDDRRGDIIFIHGLGGNSRITWQGNDPKFFWPEQLAKKFPDVGIWSVSYNASPSKWFGCTMPIVDRSKNLLKQMEVEQLGTRPVVFIGHSLGGVVIKQMLQHAFTMNSEVWEEIGSQIRGVFFFATPHTGANFSVLPEILKSVARPSMTVDELVPDAAMLRNLNEWYCRNASKYEIETEGVSETIPVPPFSQLVVGLSESGTNIPQLTTTPIGGKNHLTICKIDGEDDMAYKAVVRFVAKSLTPLRPPWDISFRKFVEVFGEERQSARQLEVFKKEHVGQKVTWTAWILEEHLSDKDKPAYSIGPDKDTPARNQVIVLFLPRDFKAIKQPVSVGSQVQIEGVLEETTSPRGAILHEGRIIP